MNKKAQQLSKIIIGQLVIIAVVTGLMFFLFNGITNYNSTPPTGYNTSYTRINSITAELASTMNETRTELDSINSNTGGLSAVTDFLGFIFGAGYKAAKIAASSISGVNTLIDVSLTESQLGVYGDVLKILLLIGVVVVFIIGILLNFIIKSGRE